MNRLIDTLIESYQEPARQEFEYEVGQTVRIVKSLSTDTHEIRGLLGKKGIIKHRFTTGLRKENKYEVVFPNGRVEVFDETEFDRRYRKRRKKEK